MMESRPIARLTLPDEAALDSDLRDYFAACREKLGLVPNVIRAYSARPARLRNFIAAYRTIMLDEDDCGLTKLEREMIALVVSSANRCPYCLAAHGQAVRRLAGDPALGEALVHNWRTAALDTRRRAMLAFAWKLTVEPDAIGEADRQALSDAGFDERDLFDIAETAAFFNYTNRMAHALEILPNPEYHGMDR